MTFQNNTTTLSPANELDHRQMDNSSQFHLPTSIHATLPTQGPAEGTSSHILFHQTSNNNNPTFLNSALLLNPNTTNDIPLTSLDSTVNNNKYMLLKHELYQAKKQLADS